ncbi:MAG: recombinase family protein [Bariatricus sp.]
MRESKETEMKKRAAVYCRVSTAEELQEDSFEIQKFYYMNQIQKSPDLVLADVYGDKGKSGRSMQGRTEFQRMIRDCENGKIDLILTKSISRFARNMGDCISTIRRLQEMGIPVIFEKEAINTEDDRNELFLCILATIAQEESNSISRHLNWSRRERCLKGRPYGEVSYGYRAGKPDHIWRIEESEAKRVRTAFEMASKGYCYMDIRAVLQKMEDEEKTGKKWGQCVLSYMLTNLYYTGDYLSNKTCEIETGHGKVRVKNKGQKEQIYIEGHHEPLVSRARFERVQKLMQMRLLNSKKTRFTEEERRFLEDCKESYHNLAER